MSASRAVLRAIAVVLFAAVTAVLFIASDPVQAGAVLYVLPVALLAISDGRPGGLGAAAVATVGLAAWVLIDDVGLNALGWLARIASFVTVGWLVGHYAQVASRLERKRIEQRYATELHDQVLQELVVARYALPDDHIARPHVDEALSRLKEIISERVIEPDPGELRISGAPPPPASPGEATAP
jgi:signal transduction histidine kinase